MIKHSVQVVLHSPQIPPNTGSIARTCAATDTVLHLVKPISFDISEKAVRRAGVDYWDEVKLKVHESWDSFLSFKSGLPGRLLAFSPAGLVLYSQFEYQSSDWIVHGKESDGLPLEVVETCDCVLYIPMFNPRIRSLNLAASATLSLYTALSRLS